MASLLEEMQWVERDLLLVGLMLVCLVLGIGAVFSSFEKREATVMIGGARKVDLAKIKRQIIDGNLSSQKAMFYKKVPR